MMYKYVWAALSCLFSFTLVAQNPTTAMIIPEPVLLELQSGAPFLLQSQTTVEEIGQGTAPTLAFLQDYLTQYYGLTLQTQRDGAAAGLRLEMVPDESKPQGAYVLEVSPQQIVLKGYNPEGLFYAMQSLIQLLPVIPFQGGQSTSALAIPSLRIEDAPRFAYRGAHLDVVRHIFPVEYIKRYIDYLALHKFNYFHWHLTDDQGWRMESKRHPALNERGAYRDSTIIGLFPGTGMDTTRYGGYYTQEQLREIIQYAAKRYITVIPELDIPGHCMAVLATYPHFGTEPEREKRPAFTWGIFNRQNNVLAPTDEVFAFLKDVFEELMEIFPSPYIHLGGDECAKKWWAESAFCQDFIKKHQLNGEEGLQAYFVHYVAGIIRDKGRTPIGWNEILQGGLPEGAVVMSWQGMRGGEEAAKLGHKAIMTPSRTSYFNIMQLRNDVVIGHRGYVPIDTVYKYDPIPRGLDEVSAANIIGAQSCMWTEYYATVAELEYAVFPRISATAEVCWSPKSKRDYEDFKRRLERQKARYRLWGIQYCAVIEQ
jgi:N-acetyl-beta-hexosaminidase